MKRILLYIICSAFSIIVFSQESKQVEISKTIINSFPKGDYLKILETFDETMKTALPADKLKSVWDDLNLQVGKYQKYTEITTAKIQNYDVVYTLCHFEKMNLKMKAVFNNKNQIAGLFFIPENQK